MIYGIGVDIVEIYKIRKIVSYSGDRLAKRILSITEFDIYQRQKKNGIIRFLATRFAVKEAVSKAFGTGIRQGITFTQLEVLHDEKGKPVLHLLAYAEFLAKTLALKNMHITVSDTHAYACAMAIFEQ